MLGKTCSRRLSKKIFYFSEKTSLDISCHLGLPGPCFPSTCMSQAVLTAPLEHSMCPYQWSLLSFRMRSRSSMPSYRSSSLGLMVTVSCSLTLPSSIQKDNLHRPPFCCAEMKLENNFQIRTTIHQKLSQLKEKFAICVLCW